MQIGLPVHPGRYRLPPLEDRCAERHSVMIEGWLRPSCGHRFPIVIRDISVAGFSCEAVTGMPKGSLCWLSLPGLQGQQSEIVWNTGHMVGCAFSNLLSRVVLDHILARHR